MRRIRSAAARAAALVLAMYANTGVAQTSAPHPVRAEMFAGGDLEEYLRTLQVSGASTLHPWGIRAFSPASIDLLAPADSVHPWRDHYDLSGRVGRGPSLSLLRPRVATSFNTGFAYGANDGAVWSGRGLTTALQLGVSGRYGPLTVTLAPVAFRAENADFELGPTGQTDNRRFADWRRWPIDLPQRFGEGAYQRLDPGESSIRLDVAGVAVGLTSAREVWGPAVEYPIILSANAPGIPRAFVGTSTPWNVGVGRLQARFIWGRLAQSPYSSVSGPSSTRFGAGAVGTFQPRGIPGLELGFTRFFHLPWPEDGLRREHVLHPFRAVFKRTLRDRNPDPDHGHEVDEEYEDNQLASVFARWVFPGSGFELYGEFAKEDHNFDLRDLIVQPDHTSGYNFGFQKVWREAGETMTVLRGELVNLQANHITVHLRYQSLFYQNSRIRQGHTHRGQLLGASPGLGGAGGVLAFERIHPQGRWAVRGSREVQADSRRYVMTGDIEPKGVDVLYALGAEGTVFRRSLEITGGLTLVQNFNRYNAFDASNVRADLRVQFIP